MRRNHIITIFIIVISFSILSSCVKEPSINSQNENINTSTELNENSVTVNLPKHFTIDKIKDAILEHINYELYLYPKEVEDDITDANIHFDDYIGNSLDIEVRIYSNMSNNIIYIKTSRGDELYTVKEKDGFIYCGGIVSEGDYNWPENTEDYEVIENYSIVIPEPRKPNYGTSERKNKMIAAFESKIKSQCSEYYEHATEEYHIDWENLNVYIADFYEWENAAHAWLCSQDGSMTAYPVYFEEQDDGFYVQALKGYTMESKNQFNKFGLHQFEKDIEDAVLHFKCNVK